LAAFGARLKNGDLTTNEIHCLRRELLSDSRLAQQLCGFSAPQEIRFKRRGHERALMVLL
jgi:hypothetical protein